MDTDAMRELYRRWLPGLWNANPDDMTMLAEQLFTPEAIGHWGPGKEFVGPKVIAEKIRETFSMFSDVSVSLLNGPVVDGDWIAARWEFAATYSGGVPGIKAAAGTRVRCTGMDLLRVDGGVSRNTGPTGTI